MCARHLTPRTAELCHILVSSCVYFCNSAAGRDADRAAARSPLSLPFIFGFPMPRSEQQYALWSCTACSLLFIWRSPFSQCGTGVDMLQQQRTCRWRLRPLPSRSSLCMGRWCDASRKWQWRMDAQERGHTIGNLQLEMTEAVWTDAACLGKSEGNRVPMLDDWFGYHQH